MHCRILVVDDDQATCELLDSRLSRRGFAIDWRLSPDDALLAIRQHNYDVVLTDLRMKGLNGLQLCERITSSCPDLPVVVMTAWGSMDSAIGALRAGAHDYVTKPFSIDAVAETITRAAQKRAAERDLKTSEPAAVEPIELEGLVGRSPAMQEVFRLLNQISASESSVLITGETGTGKKTVARALHRLSPRRDRPLVTVDCAALPTVDQKGYLFGQAKGLSGQTGKESGGVMVNAHRGTLLLDRIGDLPLSLQPQLLQALQERRIRPVGGQGTVPCDTRVIATTSQDLQGAISAGRLRADLYFRLNVIQIALPPLRERSPDILLLAQRAVTHYARELNKPVEGIASAAGEKLLRYRWPGNVRELLGALERAVTLRGRGQVLVDDLPEHIRDFRHWQLGAPEGDSLELLPVDEVERRHILGVLAAVEGNKTSAARLLGVDRKTLYRKLKQYEAR